MKKFLSSLKIGDLIVALLVLAAAGAVALAFVRPAAPAVFAVVTVDGAEARRVALPASETFTLECGVTIEIDGARARIRESDCPDKYCVNAGWLDAAGERAVCLPNRVILAIEGGTGVIS